MTTRKIRDKKDEIEEGASSPQSKDNNTNTRVGAVAGAKRTKDKPVSKGKEKAAGKHATTGDAQAQVKPSSARTSGKKNKGVESKDYHKTNKHPKDEPSEQSRGNSPGRIYNEQNTRGLGVRKTEQSSRNLSGEQVYEHGASVYGEGRYYGTSEGSTQYPPHDRRHEQGTPRGFRDEFNYNDSYWWEGQFPQAASSWDGDGRWQHHARPWSHRQNMQGERRSAPYGGDYEKHLWMQRQRESGYPMSDDYREGRSRGNMTWGEAMYPDDERMREDIYQDPGRNFDRDGSGYTQAYYGATDIGRVPDDDQWNESMGGSHFHRDDLDWENWDAKRRDLDEFDARENNHRRDRNMRSSGGWTARDEYRRGNGHGGHGGDHRRDMQRMRDHMDHDNRRGDHMRTIYTNSLDTPYDGGYNERTSHADMRIGQGGYNQGGYGSSGYSYEYGNAGGYGSTGAYQTGHRGEHRRGGYQEGSRYAARQDEYKERRDRGRSDYDRRYVIGSDDQTSNDVQHSYKAKMHGAYEDDHGQWEGQVHGMQRYGEGEGSKWKGRNDGNHSGGRSMG